MLHQEPRVRMETFFFGEIPTIFVKMPTFLEKFRPFSCTPVSICLQSSLPLNVNSTAKN